jgi:hypothetical protein
VTTETKNPRLDGGGFPLVDRVAVAYLIATSATSRALTSGPSPSLRAASGRTLTVEDRAVPEEIIARLATARQASSPFGRNGFGAQVGWERASRQVVP